MPIERVQVFVKPNQETPWFHDTWDPSHNEYIKSKYKDTGKYTGWKEIMEDELMLIVTHIFTDEDAEIEFTNDEYLAGMVEKRDQYNLSHNINRLL